VSVYRTNAVVLGSHKFGEADKVIVLLTEDLGKVRAVAKGIRKTKSSIGARLEPMSLVDISLRTGRELDTVDQVKLIAPYSNIRNDFNRLRQGLAMVESINKITPDRDPVPHLFSLLSRALTALNDNTSPLMLAGFFWRLLAIEGHSPQLDVCVSCGGEDGLTNFDVLEGGVHCSSCGTGISVTPAALVIIRQILGGKMHEALALPESPAVNEVNSLAMEAMEAHLERRLRSLGVFDRHL
jgi:DNA repair protein RecO (recombination protein O)